MTMPTFSGIGLVRGGAIKLLIVEVGQKLPLPTTFDQNRFL